MPLAIASRGLLCTKGVFYALGLALADKVGVLCMFPEAPTAQFAPTV